MKALNYYPHEEKMNNLIDYFFYDNSIFYITGNSGCGKSYTFINITIIFIIIFKKLIRTLYFYRIVVN